MPTATGQRNRSHLMTVKEAVIQVLQTEGKPLHTKAPKVGLPHRFYLGPLLTTNLVTLSSQ